MKGKNLHALHLASKYLDMAVYIPTTLSDVKLRQKIFSTNLPRWVKLGGGRLFKRREWGFSQPTQPQQQMLCLLSTVQHGHQREEAVLPRGEGLREQPNFPRKDTARSRQSRCAIGLLGKEWSWGMREEGSASHSSNCYVHSPLSGMGTRERRQYCPEGKVCASNLTSHVRTLPGVET